MRKKLLFIIFCLSALTGFAQTANTHSQTDDLKGKRIGDRKSTRLNSSHTQKSRMPSSA